MFELLALGSLVEKQQGGGTPPRNDPAFWHGDIPWASVKDFKDDQLELKATEETITSLGLRSSTSSLIPPGTPMVCTRMAVGRCAVSQTPTAINQDVRALYPKKGVNHRYLLRLVASLQRKAESLSVGSTVKGIRSSDFLAINTHIAPENEQGAIAHILDTLDTQIQKTEALIAKLEKVKEGLLHDLLTRGIDENGRLRPSPEHAPELYKESPLGLIPRGWDVEKLKDLSSNGMVNGVFKEVSRAGIGTPLVNVADLYRGDEINLEGCERFDANEVEIGKYDASPGDVFFTRSSLKLEGIAHCNWLKSPDKPAVFECHIIRVRPSSKVDSRFLVAWCRSSNARLHFMGNAKQVTMTTISQDGIGSLPCPVPSIDEQKKASERILSLERRVADEKLKMNKLNNQKQALMDDLLTGRVRVTPLLDQAQATTPA